MRKDIAWSPLADEDLTNVLNYLRENWNIAVTLRFLDKIESITFIISRHPDRYPMINRELGIRKCIVTKHNALFYRELSDKIEIVRLFDTRQDPAKLGY